MIEKERIEAVKRGIDLAAVVESRGVKLRKNGKGLVGLCPFHDDTNPSLSVNTQTNLWQCFGCGTGGDVIRFVELFDKVPFPEAVRKLNGSMYGKGQAGPPSELPPPQSASDQSSIAATYARRFACRCSEDRPDHDSFFWHSADVLYGCGATTSKTKERSPAPLCHRTLLTSLYRISRHAPPK